MPVHITNTSYGLVSVELNSGDTLHLAPGERSGAVEPFEVGDNLWVRMLAEQGRITMESPTAEPRTTQNPRPVDE
ncbi:hypothetical protein [Nonomuraea endophytica]|uniref:hypothetical protein n=1 Tax=Nonomuraea endophytica TaxID=714136 RepID=UPI0037C8CD32